MDAISAGYTQWLESANSRSVIVANVDMIMGLISMAEGTYPTETKQIALQTARNPAEAAIFNHASMAFNNHFYFQSISTSPDRDMDPRLKDALVKDFGSLENLRSEMLAMGEAMFGPGFVWLVRVPSSAGSVGKEFKLLNTYLAGSPFAGAHNRRQAIDMNTQNVANAVAAGGVEGLARGATLLQHQTPQNNVGAFGQHSRLNAAENVALGGVDVLPCLCVSTWEHSYMLDWRYEKRNFLERWWTFINWDVVRQRSGVENDSQQSRQTTYEKARGQTSYGRR